MKNQFLVLGLFLLANFGLAQSGTIKGIIVDINQKVLPGVNVSVKKTTKGTHTDENGEFKITNLERGNYILSLSYIGFKNREVLISISEDQNMDLGEIVLYEGNVILGEVIVERKRVNKFARKKTAYVSKLPLKDIDNSQVYSTITSDLIQSQIAINFEDVLKNATGVENLWTSTGRGGDGAGYYALRGFSVQPQLVNGLPGLTNGKINPANIERIEVLKGPSATLFGNTVSSYGGLINVVTKKPYIGTGGELSFTSGTYGLNQIVGDFNTALSKESNIYFRLNTAYTTEQSFQDAGFRKSFFVAPSLSYKVNSKLSFSLYGEITQAEQTNPTFLFLNRKAPTEASSLDELGYNNKLSFTSNDLTIKNPTQNYRIEMEYKLSDTWQSQTLLSKNSTSTKGYYSYLFDLNILKGNTYSRFISKQNSNTQSTDIQQNITGHFKIGELRNRVIIGLDYLSTTETSNNTGYAFHGNVTPSGVANGDNPFTKDVEDTTYPLSTSAVDAVLASQEVGNSKSRYNIYSLYVCDVLNVSKNISAMIGLRLDHFDSEGDTTNSEDDYNQTTLSPKFGVIYQPIIDNLSIFANYQNGFTNVAPQLVGDPKKGPQTLKTFNPEQANQIEFGVKTNLFDDKLNITASYYNIKVKDRVITDPSSPFNKIQGGEIISKGYEIEINTNPVKGLNIRASYSDNNSETIKSDNKDILNRRPLEAGPEKLYNFWTDYEFQKGKLEGFGLGFGLNGASERFAINYKSTGEFILPSYTIVNASVFYQADRYRIGLKLNNALNEEYYKGWTTIHPQKPRSVLLNVTYKF